MTAAVAERRRRSGRPLLGKETPRIWTPPKRRLTPRTSRGYACIAFAAQLGIDLYPWQKWLLIHALELNPDGTYRFRVVVVLVARQNGKTTLLKVLALWRMLEDDARRVVGTSTNMEYAREAWSETVDLAEGRDLRVARERALAELGEDGELPEDDDELLAFLPKRDRWVASIKRGALDTSLTLRNRHRYKVATASGTGGRSLSIDLGIADELREHRPKGELSGWEAWAALDGATTARPKAQVYGLSNAGDRGSVVLNHFREVGVAFIETGEGDDTLGLFEWSGEDDCDLLDRAQWAQANPALGYGGITEATLLSKSRLPAPVFRTEHLCQGVPTLRSAIDPQAWRTAADKHGTLTGLRSRTALCVQVSEDLEHVTLVAAAQLDDGRVRGEAVAAWSSVEEARSGSSDKPSLYDHVRKIRPRLFGWYPTGPGAVLDVELTKAFPKDKGRPRGRRLVGGDVTAAGQGLAEFVLAGRVLHPDDPLVNAHIIGASKLQVGDGWRFVRRDAGHVDAAEAFAGAVHLARQIPRVRSTGLVTSSS
jgi:hypothetical protein